MSPEPHGSLLGSDHKTLRKEKTDKSLLQFCKYWVAFVLACLTLVSIVDIGFAFLNNLQVLPISISVETTGPNLKISVAATSSATLIQSAQVNSMECRIFRVRPTFLTEEDHLIALSDMVVVGPIFAQSRLESILHTSQPSTPEVEITSIDFSVLRQSMLDIWKQDKVVTGYMTCRIDGTVFLLDLMPLNINNLAWDFEFPVSFLPEDNGDDETLPQHSSPWNWRSILTVLSDDRMAAISDMLGHASKEGHVFPIAQHVNIAKYLPETLRTLRMTSSGAQYEVGAETGENISPHWLLTIEPFSVNLADPQDSLRTNIVVGCTDIDKGPCSLLNPLRHIHQQLQQGYIDISVTALAETAVGSPLVQAETFDVKKSDLGFLPHLIGTAFKLVMKLPPDTTSLVLQYGEFMLNEFLPLLWHVPHWVKHDMRHDVIAGSNVEVDRCVHVTVNEKLGEACLFSLGSGFRHVYTNVSYDNIEKVKLIFSREPKGKFVVQGFMNNPSFSFKLTGNATSAKELLANGKYAQQVTIELESGKLLFVMNFVFQGEPSRLLSAAFIVTNIPDGNEIFFVSTRAELEVTHSPRQAINSTSKVDVAIRAHQKNIVAHTLQTELLTGQGLKTLTLNIYHHPGVIGAFDIPQHVLGVTGTARMDHDPRGDFESIFLDDVYVFRHRQEIFYLSYLPFDFWGVRRQVISVPMTTFGLRINGDAMHGEVEFSRGNPSSDREPEDIFAKMLILKENGDEYVFVGASLDSTGMLWKHFWIQIYAEVRSLGSEFLYADVKLRGDIQSYKNWNVGSDGAVLRFSGQSYADNLICDISRRAKHNRDIAKYTVYTAAHSDHPDIVGSAALQTDFTNKSNGIYVISMVLTSTRPTSRRTDSEYRATVNTHTQSLRLDHITNVVNSTHYPTVAPTLSMLPTKVPNPQPSSLPTITNAPTTAIYYQFHDIELSNFSAGRELTFTGLSSHHKVFVSVEVLNIDQLCGGNLLLVSGNEVIYGTVCSENWIHGCEMIYRTCMNEIDVSNYVDPYGNLTLKLLADENILCELCFSTSYESVIRANMVVTSIHLASYQRIEPFTYVWEGGFMNYGYHVHTIPGLIGMDNLFVTFEVFPTDYNDYYSEYMYFNWYRCFPNSECGTDFYTCREENVGKQISDLGSYIFSMFFLSSTNYCPHNGYYYYVRVKASSVSLSESTLPPSEVVVAFWEGGSSSRKVEHTFNAHTFGASPYKASDELFIQVDVYETDFDQHFEYVKLVQVGNVVLSTYCNPNKECGDQFFVCLRDVNVASLIDWDSGNLTVTLEVTSTVDVCLHNGYALYSRITLYSQQYRSTSLPSSTPTALAAGSTLNEVWSGRSNINHKRAEIMHTFTGLQLYENVYLSVDISYPFQRATAVQITVNGEDILLCTFELQCSYDFQSCLVNRDMKGIVTDTGDLTVEIKADTGASWYKCQKDDNIDVKLTVLSDSSESSYHHYYQQWEGAGPNVYYGSVDAVFTGLTGVYKALKLSVEIYVAKFGQYDRVNNLCEGSNTIIPTCSRDFQKCATDVEVSGVVDGGVMNYTLTHVLHDINWASHCDYAPDVPIWYRVTLESPDPYFTPTSAPSIPPSLVPTPTVSDNFVVAEGGNVYTDYTPLTLRLVVTNPNVQWRLQIEVYVGDYGDSNKYFYYLILVNGNWVAYYCYPNIACTGVFYECTSHDSVNNDYIDWISPTEGVVTIRAYNSYAVYECGYNGYSLYARATLYPITTSPTWLPSSLPSESPTSPTSIPSSVPSLVPSLSLAPTMSVMPTTDLFVTVEGGSYYSSKKFLTLIPRPLHSLYLKVELYAGMWGINETVGVYANNSFVGVCIPSHSGSCLSDFITCVVDREVSAMVNWRQSGSGVLSVSIRRENEYDFCGHTLIDEFGNTGIAVIYGRVTLSSVTSPSLTPTAIPTSNPTESPSNAPSAPTPYPSSLPSALPSATYSPSMASIAPTTHINAVSEFDCPPYSASQTSSASVRYVTCPIYACPGNTVTVSLCRQCNGDTYLRLFTSNGVMLTASDDYCNLCSQLTIVLTTSSHISECQNIELRQGCYSSDSCSGQSHVTRTYSTTGTHCPTLSPENALTRSPTTRPNTIVPTQFPSFVTQSPTLLSSIVPSRSPTSSPTIRPSGLPSRSPTSNPTIRPSAVPSQNPTPSPTIWPSILPSRSPSPSHTVIPSEGSSMPVGTGLEFDCPPYSASQTSDASIGYVTCPIYACPGNTVTVSLCRQCNGDTYLRLFTSNGVMLTANDDYCNLCSQLTIVLTTSHISECQNIELRQGCFSSDSCSGQSHVIVNSLNMETYSPTIFPTYVQTPNPTAIPSKPPTAIPTLSPTAIPSLHPTIAPSAPTWPPTHVPSKYILPLSKLNASLVVSFNNTLRYWFPVPVWRCSDSKEPVPASDFSLKVSGKRVKAKWMVERDGEGGAVFTTSVSVMDASQPTSVSIRPIVDLCHGVSREYTSSDSHHQWMQIVPRTEMHLLSRYYPMGGSGFGNNVMSIYPPYEITSEYSLSDSRDVFLRLYSDLHHENITLENITLLAFCQFGPAMYSNISYQENLVAFAVINTTTGYVQCVVEPASPPLKENQEAYREVQLWVHWYWHGFVNGDEELIDIRSELYGSYTYKHTDVDVAVYVTESQSVLSTTSDFVEPLQRWIFSGDENSLVTYVEFIGVNGSNLPLMTLTTSYFSQCRLRNGDMMVVAKDFYSSSGDTEEATQLYDDTGSVVGYFEVHTMDVQMYISFFNATKLDDPMWCNETDAQYSAWTNKSTSTGPTNDRRQLSFASFLAFGISSELNIGLSICAMATASIDDILLKIPFAGKAKKVADVVSRTRSGAQSAIAFSDGDAFGYLHGFFSIFAQTAFENTIMNAVKCAQNLVSGAKFIAGVYDCVKTSKTGDTLDKLGNCVCKEHKPDFKCAQRNPSDNCCPATQSRVLSTPGFYQTVFQQRGIFQQDPVCYSKQGTSMVCCYARGALCTDETAHLCNGVDTCTSGTKKDNVLGASVDYFEKSLLDLGTRQLCCALRKEYCDGYVEGKTYPQPKCPIDTPPSVPHGVGDVHYLSADGKRFDLHIWGEAVLLLTPSIVIQSRTRSLWHDNCEDAQTGRFATVTIGIATSVHSNANAPNVSVLIRGNQLAIYISSFPNDDGTETPSVEEISIHKYGSIMLEGMTITRQSLSIVQITYSSGVTLTITGGGQWLNTNIRLDKSNYGKTSGIVGLYNGNVEDDFTLRNGSYIPIDSNQDTIFHVFGADWTLLTAQESRFYYAEDESFEDQKCHKLPYFGDTSTVVADPVRRAEVYAFCEANVGGVGKLDCVTEMVVMEAVDNLPPYSERNAVTVGLEITSAVETMQVLVNPPPFFLRPASTSYTFHIGVESVITFVSVDENGLNTSISAILTPPDGIVDIWGNTANFTWTPRTAGRFKLIMNTTNGMTGSSIVVTISVPVLNPTPFPTSLPSVMPTSPSLVPTSLPSTLPTKSPISNPTTPPTGVPTSPSLMPTSLPTNTPTKPPTHIPTCLPSASPTSPSSHPSGQPSSQPSWLPTAIPTSPSALPTSDPTFYPTCPPSGQPSSSPSALPSSSPSSVPSAEPTGEPTGKPTGQPSGIPTGVPSALPSTEPTGVPSGEPTTVPTGIPSGEPTSAPTGKPSSLPTSTPSGQPTTKPTGEPSGEPSSMPTGEPTRVPTSEPSGEPTVIPTGEPTTIPSGKPSGEPTKIPSGEPSSHPSADPSGKPSGQPSGEPSRVPTTVPSSAPSAVPTGEPSGEPTKIPTGEPTGIPTVKPSGEPTVIPTGEPTVIPSGKPSGEPTKIPTGEPTGIPTVKPSGEPTVIPTAEPTVIPSGKPSGEPSSNPSGEPSSHPSAVPTSLPSSDPTATPSVTPIMTTAIMPSEMVISGVKDKSKLTDALTATLVGGEFKTVVVNITSITEIEGGADSLHAFDIASVMKKYQIAYDIILTYRRDRYSESLIFQTVVNKIDSAVASGSLVSRLRNSTKSSNESEVEEVVIFHSYSDFSKMHVLKTSTRAPTGEPTEFSTYDPTGVPTTYSKSRNKRPKTSLGPEDNVVAYSVAGSVLFFIILCLLGKCFFMSSRETTYHASPKSNVKPVWSGGEVETRSAGVVLGGGDVESGYQRSSARSQSKSVVLGNDSIAL